MSTRRFFKGYIDFLGPFGAQRLSVHAQSMLLALMCQYDGHNNGSLKITASTLPARWRRSSAMRQKARGELINAAFVFEVARGWRPNRASLYALACFPLDHNPQHDPDLVARFDPHAWRHDPNSAMPSGGTTLCRPTAPQNQKRYAAPRHYGVPTVPPDGIASPAIVPPHGIETANSLCRPTATYKKSIRLLQGDGAAAIAKVAS